MAAALLGLDELIAVGDDGRTRLAGTRVTVSRIAGYLHEGLTPDQIVDDVFEGYLSLAQVHAAIACYHRNRAAIDADRAGLDETYERNAAHSSWTPPPG